MKGPCYAGPRSSVGNVSDTWLTAYPGVASSIPAWSHTAILLPSADSRRVVVSYKWKYVHEVLVNRLVKLAEEKVWLGE